MTFGHGVFDCFGADATYTGSTTAYSDNTIRIHRDRKLCKPDYEVVFDNPKRKDKTKTTSSLDKAIYYAQSEQYSPKPRAVLASWWRMDMEKIQSIREDGKWKGTPVKISRPKSSMHYGYYLNKDKNGCTIRYDYTQLEPIDQVGDDVTHGDNEDKSGNEEDWQEVRCTPETPTWSSFGPWSECEKGRFHNFSKKDNEKDAGFMERVRTLVHPGKSCPGMYITPENIKTHEMKACCPDPNSTPTWSGSGMSDDLESQGYGPNNMPKCKCKTGYEMNDDGMCEKPASDADFCGDANAKKVNSECVCKDGYTRAMTDDEWRTNNTGPNNSTCIKEEAAEEPATTTTTTTPATTTVTTQSSTTTPAASEKGDGKGLLALALVGGLGVFAYQRRKRGK